MAKKREKNLCMYKISEIYTHIIILCSNFFFWKKKEFSEQRASLMLKNVTLFISI